MIAKRITKLTFAPIREMLNRAADLETKGHKVIHFEIGRPDFDTPVHIKAAAIGALDQGFVHYTTNAGIPNLRRAIAHQIKSNLGLAYDPDKEIMVTAGAQQAIFFSFQALLNPGDEVLLPNPGFGPYYTAATLAGAVPTPYHLRPSNYTWDTLEAEKAVSPNTKAIVINSPGNPTGTVFNQDQVAEIAKFVKRYNLTVISDEVYDHLLFDGVHHHSPAAQPEMKERTVVINSFSKTYSMTGWRLGYAAASPEIVNAFIRLQQNVMLSVCSFAQKGALMALTGDRQCIVDMVKQFSRRRDIIYDGLKDVHGLKLPSAPPQGAFYLFVDHRETGLPSEAFSKRLLEEAHVAVAPGFAFGPDGEGFFRLSFATGVDDCSSGVKRITQFVSSL